MSMTCDDSTFPAASMNEATLTLQTGEGEGKPDWASTPTGKEPTSPRTLSFAPRGPSLLQFRFRRKLPQPLTLKVPQKGAVAGIHDSCSVSVSPQIFRIQ